MYAPSFIVYQVACVKPIGIDEVIIDLSIIISRMGRSLTSQTMKEVLCS